MSFVAMLPVLIPVSLSLICALKGRLGWAWAWMLGALVLRMGIDP